MMGSAHDGETLNAARFADRYRRSLRVTWNDVIDPPPAPPSPQQYGYVPRDWPARWRWVACACLESDQPLSAIETKLLRKITVYRCVSPSAAQLLALRGIADRVLARAAA